MGHSDWDVASCFKHKLFKSDIFPHACVINTYYTNLIYPVQFLEPLFIQIIDLTWMNELQMHVYHCLADQKLVQILNLSTMAMYHFYSPALTVLSNFLQEEKYTHSSWDWGLKFLLKQLLCN